MIRKLMHLFKDEEGVTALEYGLIAALIAAAIVVAVQALGTQVSDTFDSVADAMGGASAT